MRRPVITAVLAAASATATLLGGAAAPAQAATGRVVVFSTELQPLDVYENPQQGTCYKLPPFSHLLDNLTDSTVHVYAAPGCLFPAALNGSLDGSVKPGFGNHVIGTGSFKVY
ncbi:hypothetical protein ACIGXM_26420 [Kitasatospora sp. NPDC052896]|uniref:hypothetical protein n=1 Tax=Kitasatospora sp. NPDC052896 TaxID=3364061 RepID=UPI0037CBA2AE